MRTLFEMFDATQELLEAGWTAHTLAVTEKGESISPTDERAVKYCIMGGFEAIAFYEANEDRDLTRKIVRFMNSILNMANLGILTKGGNYNMIEHRNDNGEKDEAIAMLQRSKDYVERKMGRDYTPEWLVAARASFSNN